MNAVELVRPPKTAEKPPMWVGIHAGEVRLPRAVERALGSPGYVDVGYNPETHAVHITAMSEQDAAESPHQVWAVRYRWDKRWHKAGMGIIHEVSLRRWLRSLGFDGRCPAEWDAEQNCIIVRKGEGR